MATRIFTVHFVFFNIFIEDAFLACL
uniref:Uncharacterized protein n=1 Tax=Rhizophora mucronata TaxID=61149 RepID=A0A2P2PS23_RHIMU